MGHLDPQERARLRAVRRAELERLGQRKFAEQRNATYVKGGGAALVATVVDLAGSATTVRAVTSSALSGVLKMMTWIGSFAGHCCAGAAPASP